MRELTLAEIEMVDGAWDFNEVSYAAYGLAAVAGTAAIYAAPVPLASGALAATGLILTGIGIGGSYLYTYH